MPRVLIPAVGLALMALMALLHGANLPAYLAILERWGIIPTQTPFIDLEYLGSAVACWSKGTDVYVANPCDIMSRVYTYSPLWLRSPAVPTSRAWTNGMGLCLGASFFASLYALLRPATWKEGLVLVVFVTSTSTVFAVERGNVDILLFVMVVAAVLASGSGLAIRLLSYALVLFGGLLKFYPLIGLAYAVKERLAVLILTGLVSAAVTVAFVVTYATELRAMAPNIPTGSAFSDLFGASNLPKGLGFRILPAVAGLQTGGPDAYAAALIAGFLLAAAVGGTVLWVRSQSLRDATAGLGTRDEAALMYGALLVAGCFFAGQSVGYRGIWLIPVAAGIIALGRVSTDPALRRHLGVLLAIAAVLVWEGLIRTALSGADGKPTLRYAAFWLIRELFWWYLVTFLSGIIVAFGLRSPLFRTLLGVVRRQGRR